MLPDIPRRQDARKPKKGRERRAKSMMEVRHEVRREIDQHLHGAGGAHKKARRRRLRTPQPERAASSLGDLDFSMLSFDPMPNSQDISRLSGCSSTLMRLDPTQVEEDAIDEFTGKPVEREAPRYSQKFLNLLFSTTPRELGGPDEQSEAPSKVSGPIKKDMGPPRGPHKPEPSEWWDWDMAGGGIGGRWADDEPSKAGKSRGSATPGSEQQPSRRADTSVIAAANLELEPELAAFEARRSRAQKRSQQHLSNRSSMHRQQLLELSQTMSGPGDIDNSEQLQLPTLRSIAHSVKLSTADMKLLKAAFHDQDPEDDGLTVTEFVDFFTQVVSDDTPNELRVLFMKMDSTGEGTLGCDEFLSYLLHRSSQSEAQTHATMLTSILDTGHGGGDPNSILPERSAEQHGCMVNRLVPVKMTAGSIPLYYATTGRPKNSQASSPGGPEHSVVLWRASDLGRQTTLASTTLMPLPARGVAKQDAVSYLRRTHGDRDALTTRVNLDDREAQGAAKRNLLEKSARVVDLANWPRRQVLVILVDNTIMGPFLCFHRHKDLLGSVNVKIDRVPLQQQGNANGRPSCFYLCPPTEEQPVSPCPSTFIVGDHGGHVCSYRPDGSQIAHGKWHAGEVSRIRLITVRQGELCRVVSISSGEDSCIVLADAVGPRTGAWKPLRRSDPVRLGIRSFDHSPQFGVIVSAGADRKVRVWVDDSLVLTAELTGHKAPVVDVSVNERAAHVASCDTARHLRVWNLSTFECIQSVGDNMPHPPENAFSAMLLDSISNRLVVAGSFLSVWAAKPGLRARPAGAAVQTQPAASMSETPLMDAAATGEISAVVGGGGGAAVTVDQRKHSSKVVSVSYSHRFGQCVTMDEHGEVYVHECTPRGDAPRVLTFGVAATHGGASLTGATLDANGARLFTGSANGQVRLWNINSGEAMVDELSEEEAANFVVRAALSADSRHTATELEKRQQPASEISSLRWLVGSNASSYYHLMATGWAGAVILWKDPALPSGQPLQLAVPSNPRSKDKSAHADVISSCVTDAFVAAGTADGRVLLWFFSTSDRRISAPTPKFAIDMPPLPLSERSSWPATNAAAADDDDGDDDDDDAGGARRPDDAPPSSGALSMSAVPDALFWVPRARVLLALGMGQISLISVYSGEVTLACIAWVHGASAAAISDDGERLAVGTASGEVVVYDCSHVAAKDPDSLRELGRCTLEGSPRISCLCFTGRPSPDDRSVEASVVPKAPDWVLCGCDDGGVILCSAVDGAAIGSINMVGS